MVKIKDYFDVKYGANLEFYKMEEDQKGIPFVARTEKNNGVVGRVKIIQGVKPNPANTISVAGGGSVLSSFLQNEEYYSGRDLYYLVPKLKLNERELLFYCMCIRANAFRYSYGRQANKTLKEIEIPDKTHIPKWIYNIKIDSIERESVLKGRINLNVDEWKYFKITRLFDIKKGERIVKEERINGNTPLVTAISENNGVVDFISFDDFKDSKKIFNGKLTIDMFFNVFYHNYSYFSDDNVHTLIPRGFYLNKYICLFLVTVLKRLSYKYDYGRQVRLQRLEFDKIKLPARKDGTPDWQFMEEYIKSLPYSVNL